MGQNKANIKANRAERRQLDLNVNNSGDNVYKKTSIKYNILAYTACSCFTCYSLQIKLRISEKALLGSNILARGKRGLKTILKRLKVLYEKFLDENIIRK